MTVRAIKANWTDAVLVCRKCSRKAGGGFGARGKTSLVKALRKYLGVKKGRKARVGVVEVGCLGICPKNGVTVIDTHHPGSWLVVGCGTPVGDVARRLDV